MLFLYNQSIYVFVNVTGLFYVSILSQNLYLNINNTNENMQVL